MRTTLIPILFVTALAVAGCSSQPKAESNAAQPSAQGETEHYASITSSKAPFYQFGPAQPAGPDFYLNKGDLVKYIRKEMGFSRVQLEMGQIGYVANKFLAAAPAPAPAPSVVIETATIESLPQQPQAKAAPSFRLGTSTEEEKKPNTIRFR